MDTMFRIGTVQGRPSVAGKSARIPWSEWGTVFTRSRARYGFAGRSIAMHHFAACVQISVTQGDGEPL